VVELGDATLLPGLMDMHNHLMIEPGYGLDPPALCTNPGGMGPFGGTQCAAPLLLANGFHDGPRFSGVSRICRCDYATGKKFSVPSPTLIRTRRA